jgi:asparagine synthase (glutamine-hydrolysing)
MCSILGIISSSPFPEDRIRSANACMNHRGPDGQGFFQWDNGNTWVSFAHNRLSVIDLTSASDQPFCYLDRYVLIFNGEIYNYKELRESLVQKGYRFQTTGDTEVVAAAYAAYGEQCLDQFDGMFAFAVWDEKEQILFAARDRFGEKPFFYHYDSKSQTLYFASNIKALLALGLSDELNNSLLYNYMTLGHVKQIQWPDSTFFTKVFQLPPSHLLHYDIGKKKEPVVARYFDLDKESIIELDESMAHEQFMALLNTSVQRRNRSDVKTGTSLSGGLDSSAITALCKRHGSEQYSHHAFSAVFPGFEKDENFYIDQVASDFKIEVHKVSPGAGDLAAQLQTIIHHQEEPFGSSSVLAQYAVFEEAKKNNVTVLLDGQGADEALAGYTKYTHWYLQELIRAKGWTEANVEAVKYKENNFLENWSWKNRVAAAFPSLTANTLIRKSVNTQRNNPYIDREFRQTFADTHSIFKPLVEKLNDIQYHDLMIMGIEELLRYADRNSMAHSREVRLPFLSHELVQFVLSLPSHFRMRNGYTKWILRKNMETILPESIVWRKSKIGFEPPQRAWMQDAAIVDLVMAGRRKLVDHKVLNSSILDKPIIASSAHSSDNFDFRTMIAGAWIS